MRIVRKIILAGGLQNLWQVGGIYPLNLLSMIYFISISRFKIGTKLDYLIVGYLVAGVISLAIGFVLALVDGGDPDLILNALKSFFVFTGILVYFGAHQLEIDDFFKVSMWVVSAISAAILVNYLYIFLNEPISLYLSRGALEWCSGWPQRWIVFPIIGHFLFLYKYDYSKKIFDILYSIAFLVIIILSSTRSAVLGVIVGYFIMAFMSKIDLLRTISVILVISFIISIFIDEFQEAFRFQEVQEYSGSNDVDGSSIGNRIHNLWPGIVKSLGIARLAFGWGHVGVAFIPHNFFIDQSEMSSIRGEQVGTAESEYMDVLVRQGGVGLAILLLILICGLIYSYKLYKIDHRHRYIWKSSIAWQAAIIVHGITVETTRFPLYNLFFFLFLGILSQNYYRFSKLKGAAYNSGNSLTLKKQNNA